MDSEGLKEQLGKSKKMLIALGGVVLFGVYMLWPSGADPVPETSDLDAELAALQASRSTGGVPVSNFSGTDNRGVTLGPGGDLGDAGGSTFETGNPDIFGTLVGYGTQTDPRGEYLVAYIRNEKANQGYEVDLRAVVRYRLDPPSQWRIDETVYVFGEQVEGNRYVARSVR